MGFFGEKKPHFGSGGGRARLALAVLPGELRVQQGTEDPARGFSSLTIKEAELLITLMTGVAAGEFQLLWTLGLGVFLCVSGSHPVAAVQFCAQCVLWLCGQRRKPLLFLLERGGGLSPAPHSRAASPGASAGTRGVENGLVCLVTSVLGS